MSDYVRICARDFEARVASVLLRISALEESVDDSVAPPPAKPEQVQSIEEWNAYAAKEAAYVEARRLADAVRRNDQDLLETALKDLAACLPPNVWVKYEDPWNGTQGAVCRVVHGVRSRWPEALQGIYLTAWNDPVGDPKPEDRITVDRITVA